MELEASNGQRVLAYLVFGHALRFFKDSCLRAINEGLMGEVSIGTEDVQWVITVPAIWRQSAKQFMRFAATEVISYVNINMKIVRLWYPIIHIRVSNRIFLRGEGEGWGGQALGGGGGDEKKLAGFKKKIFKIVTLPELNNLSIIYQIKAVSALVKGKTDESYQAINTGIDLEMSWLNYVLFGKVYEMKGMNREAADAYLTAFNLRPGANTLYWIENGIFQTSVPYVVPYLDKFLASE